LLSLSLHLKEVIVDSGALDPIIPIEVSLN
jgi:hypothetical protein